MSTKLLALCGLLLSSPGFAATYFLATDHTGANTQIDSSASSTWLLTPNTPFDLGGGIFDMKRGSGTTENITLAVYQGTNTSGTLLSSVTLTPAAFTQSYQLVNFFFGSPVALTAGTTYFAILSSNAATNGNEQYFIKDGGLLAVDEDNIPIDPPPIGGNGAGVPEPGTLALFGVALVGLGLRSRFRRSRLP